MNRVHVRVETRSQPQTKRDERPKFPDATAVGCQRRCDSRSLRDGIYRTAEATLRRTEFNRCRKRNHMDVGLFLQVVNLPRRRFSIQHDRQAAAADLPSLVCIARQMVTWCEETTPVFHANIEAGSFKLADGENTLKRGRTGDCLLYTSPSPRD